MKVDTELRAAITATSKGQVRNRYSWKEKEAAIKLAVEALDKKKKGKLTKLFAAYDEVLKKAGELGDAIQEMGVSKSDSYRYSSLCDDDAFVAAGGVLPKELAETREWKPEQVIARLVAVTTQKEFDSILAEYGIIWK